MRRLGDSLIQDPQQKRARHATTPLPRRLHELTDLAKSEPQRLGLPDELQAMEIGLSVEAIPSRAAPGRRQKAPALVEPEAPDAEPGALSDLADREPA
jgi:hypothetical protein